MGIRKNNSHCKVCLVCGYMLSKKTSFLDRCDCCGQRLDVTFGEDITAIKADRDHWIDGQSAEWAVKEMQPADWSVEKAWEQILANVPEKLQ